MTTIKKIQYSGNGKENFGYEIDGFFVPADAEGLDERFNSKRVECFAVRSEATIAVNAIGFESVEKFVEYERACQLEWENIKNQDKSDYSDAQ